MRRMTIFVARADAFCGRLNDGLLAVATVLAILTAGVSIEQRGVAFDYLDAEWPVVDTGD